MEKHGTEGCIEIERWTALLRTSWEELARSPYRDFFVASHRGWDQAEVWAAQARFDADIVLHELGDAELAGLDVLELGCGVGRLARCIAPRVRSYTGIDIAPTMVAEARRRCADLASARFLASDGGRVPDAARDRRYGLVFAFAVFLHLPRELIATLVADVCTLLAPGGEFRCQLLADGEDPTGIRPASEAPLTVAPPALDGLDRGPLDERGLATLNGIHRVLGGRYYMGHAFRYAEVAPFLASAVRGARTRLLRFDRAHIYGDLKIA